METETHSHFQGSDQPPLPIQIKQLIENWKFKKYLLKQVSQNN